MRTTNIQRCEVRPGRLVEWTLDPATVEAARALPEDTRPPAYVQESHIRTARTVRDDGLFVPTWLGAAFDIPGHVDLDALQHALRGWTLRHETLRSGFRWNGGELRRFTLDASATRLCREDVGDFPDARALEQHLQNRFDVAADALAWPNFIYTAILRDDGASVYMAFDHTNVDAHSIHRIPAEIHELYAARVAGRASAGLPASSYVDFCEAERAVADQIDDTHSVVTRWREFIRRCDGRLPSLPIDLGLDPGAVAGGKLPTQRLMDEMLVDGTTAEGFEARCRPFGGSLVGLIAATSLIVREIGGQPVYRAVVPFHTRARSRWLDSVGWYVGGAPLEIEPAAASAPDFGGVLQLVRAALRANRPMARLPIARVLRLLGTDFRPTSPDLYSLVSFVDARATPGSERWADLKACALVRVSYGDQVCAWITRLHEGLHFATRYPDNDIAYRSMRRYVEALRELIGLVARQGVGVLVQPATVGSRARAGASGAGTGTDEAAAPPAAPPTVPSARAGGRDGAREGARDGADARRTLRGSG